MSDGPLLGCDLAIESGRAMAHNELVLSGWAVAADGVSGVVVEVGDRLLHATYGLETPWVVESMGEIAGGDRAGYELRLSTANWEPGSYPVTIAAYDQAGVRGEIAGEVRIQPFDPPKYTLDDQLAAIAAGELAMWLEEPRIVEGPCEVATPVELAGWAYAEGGVDSVVVTVDGRTHVEALRPVVRPDLLADYGRPVAGEAGFVLRLDPEECPPGRHTIAVVAIGADGRAVGVENDVICLPEPESEPGEGQETGEPGEIDWIERPRERPRARRDEPIERYDPDRHAGLVLEAEHQLRYRWAMPLAAGRDVLDAGCGVGWGSALLAQAGAERVVGLDISEEALARARERTGELAVELERADLEALPFDDATFDLVTCFEAIEHVGDPGVALEELRRVLRPDGVLLISTEPRRPSARDNVHHVHEFTSSEFERALRDRFGNVRVHRQHTFLTSAVTDDDALPIDDGATDLGIEVRKLAPGRPGGEEYIVAVAGDGDLPELGRMAMLASPRAVQRLHETAYSWEDRALLAEADSAASRNEANLARMHQEATLRALRETESEIRRLNAVLEESHAAAGERESELRARVAELEERQAAELYAQAKRQAAALRAQAEKQAAALRAAEERARHAEAQMASRERSLSWRVTRPLRFFKRTGLRTRAALRRGA